MMEIIIWTLFSQEEEGSCSRKVSPWRVGASGFFVAWRHALSRQLLTSFLFFAHPIDQPTTAAGNKFDAVIFLRTRNWRWIASKRAITVERASKHLHHAWYCYWSLLSLVWKGFSNVVKLQSQGFRIDGSLLQTQYSKSWKLEKLCVGYCLGNLTEIGRLFT